ncbi:MAG TPA: GNAT family N-acetyltransferase [Lachnospiraceae bacterium]|nr:GNAT family N-acetyltransferase [Lachnospiraceae bacterium]
MELIADVKECFDKPELLEILAGCVFNPTEERLKRRAEKYMKSPGTRIYALKQENEYIGMIVLGSDNPRQVEILDFAVRQDMQKNGVGRRMIEYCSTTFQVDSIIAETDDDAASVAYPCFPYLGLKS